MGETVQCPRCKRSVLAHRFAGAFCDVCRAEDNPGPDLLQRRWSPLSLGILSIFCDPVFITSVMTLLRSREVLRTVGELERVGEFHPSFEKQRSGAIWGMFIALVRPAAAVILLSFVIVLDIDPQTPPAPFPYDEWHEIRTDLRSNVAAEVDRGWCDADERGLTSTEFREALTFLRRSSDRPARNRCIARVLAANFTRAPRLVGNPLVAHYARVEPPKREQIALLLAEATAGAAVENSTVEDSTALDRVAADLLRAEGRASRPSRAAVEALGTLGGSETLRALYDLLDSPLGESAAKGISHACFYERAPMDSFREIITYVEDGGDALVANLAGAFPCADDAPTNRAVLRRRSIAATALTITLISKGERNWNVWRRRMNNPYVRYGLSIALHVLQEDVPWRDDLERVEGPMDTDEVRTIQIGSGRLEVRLGGGFADVRLVP